MNISQLLSKEKATLPSLLQMKPADLLVRMDPKYLASMFPRRKHESMKGYDAAAEAFNEYVLCKFGELREKDLVEFRKHANDFLRRVEAESVPFKADRVIPIVRFQKVLATSPPSLQSLFPLKFTKELIKITNFNTTINIFLIQEVVKAVVQAEETYCEILPYAQNSRVITEAKLQDFVLKRYLLRMAEPVESVRYFAAYIVGIIFFVLGARRKETVNLQDLLASTLLWHLERSTVSYNEEDVKEVDVFTESSFTTCLNEFRALDADRDGVLSREELVGHFRNREYTKRFLMRVMDISSLYDGCMDFKGYIDLFCAIRFRHTKASAKYHFEAFDVKGDGVLDEGELEYMIGLQIENLVGENDKDREFAQQLLFELKDQLQMKGKTMTVAEFVSRKEQVEFSNIITSYVAYRNYENRES